MMHPASMFCLRGALLVIAVVAITVTACDTTIPSPSNGPRAVGDVAGAWQADPFAVDPTVVAAAADVCLSRQNHVAPANAQVVLVDARGAGRLSLVFQLAERAVMCRLRLEDGAWQYDADTGPLDTSAVPPGEATASFTSVESSVGPEQQASGRTALIGRVGAGVTGVAIASDRGMQLRATVANGWFVGWWPLDDGNAIIQAVGPDGRRLGTPHP
jgi:hypothetical protein